MRICWNLFFSALNKPYPSIRQNNEIISYRGLRNIGAAAAAAERKFPKNKTRDVPELARGGGGGETTV